MMILTAAVIAYPSPDQRKTSWSSHWTAGHFPYQSNSSRQSILHRRICAGYFRDRTPFGVAVSYDINRYRNLVDMGIQVCPPHRSLESFVFSSSPLA
jgi:hypothetical protein